MLAFAAPLVLALRSVLGPLHGMTALSGETP